MNIITGAGGINANLASDAFHRWAQHYYKCWQDFESPPAVFSIGYPKGRPAGATYANQFIEEMKKSGFIQQAIERANLKGALVPK
jgi:hypothetical protein